MKRKLVGATLAVAMAVGVAMPASASAATVPLAQYGASGAGAGQLNSPFGVAVDSTGNLYVTDSNNDRVSVFSPSGTFLRAFGRDVIPPPSSVGSEVCTTATGCQAGFSGGATGALDGPRGIALDDEGNVYVADTANDRISVFRADGTFLRTFGHDVISGGATGFEVCTEQTNCKAGVAGGGAGQLSDPWDLIFDDDGLLLVAENGNDRISVFDPIGPTFVRAAGFNVSPVGQPGFETCSHVSTCQAGTGGDEAGMFDGPSGLALAEGDLYVAEEINNRISVLVGTFLFRHAFGEDVVPGDPPIFEVCEDDATGCKNGFYGSGSAGQISAARGMAIDPAGDLYVADGGANRVSVFSTEPSFLRAFGGDVIPGSPVGYEVCDQVTGCKTGTIGDTPGELRVPSDVAFDCRGAAWVADVANDRIQRFGEPGTPLAPCVDEPPAPPPAAKARCAAKVATKQGTAGPDVLRGTAAADRIAGLGGNDTIRGLGRKDVLCGGKGRDRLIGGPGNDTLLGQAGRDRLRGGPGLDRLIGGPGRDRQRQ